METNMRFQVQLAPLNPTACMHQLSFVMEIRVQVKGWTRHGLGEHVDAEMGALR